MTASAKETQNSFPDQQVYRLDQSTGQLSSKES